MSKNVNLNQLKLLISQWNENRIELFNLSEPNEHGEFHGVMRFYFQEPGEKVSTKCIRVSSSATTRHVIDALIEKFHPDMKMLSIPNYSILEVHENGEERKLQADERPLLVQITWHKDDREGRFLLRNENEQKLSTKALQKYDETNGNIKRSLKRFSKREKNKKKERESSSDMLRQKNVDVASNLYKEVPQTTFNRTISNPEIVMKKRREKNLLNKLKEIGHGGSLKIYGADLVPSRPYVTILVGVHDRAEKIVRDTLEKYGLEREDPRNFVLVEVSVPPNERLNRSISDLRSINGTERVIPNDECPLMTLLSRTERAADIFFAIRPRVLNPTNLLNQPTKTLISSPVPTNNESQYQHLANTSLPSTLPVTYAYDPILVPLEKEKEIPEAVIEIRPQVTEIGSDPYIQGIKLTGSLVHSKHCCLMFIDGVVTVTPLNAGAIVEVNGIRIERTLMLREGFVLAIGPHQFRFYLSRHQYMTQHPQLAKNGGGIHYGLPKSQSQPSETKNRPRVLPIPITYQKTRASPNPISRTPNQHVPPNSALDQHSKFRSLSATNLSQQPSVDKLDFSSKILGQMLRSTNNIPLGTRFSSTSSVNILTSTKPLAADPTPQLPALIELYDQGVEHEFLKCLIMDTPQERFPFRQSPAFILYMVVRHRISPLYRPGIMNQADRQTLLQSLLMKILERFYHVVHLNSSNSGLLIFYLANISEFLHILKADVELSSMCGTIIQGQFFELIEKTFDLLVGSCLTAIQSTMSGLLTFGTSSHHDATRDLLNYLEETVRLIRKCRLNPALTIQIFSQLFYFVNMYIFNWLVTTHDGARFISRAFGLILRERLNLLNKWSEQQGLELAAECHLDRIMQTVRYLLENYVHDPSEMPVTRDLIENVQNLASRQADVCAVQDGTKVQLEESPHLQLPFLMPQDGYVLETFRGISDDMSQFINSLQAKGICRLIPQPNTSGVWTVHTEESSTTTSTASKDHRVAHVTGNNHLADTVASPPNGMKENSKTTNFGVSSSSQNVAEIQHITLQRPPGSGIGLSIVAAQGVNDKSIGIYVKSVVEGSTAFKDGRLESGDQLLAVNGKSLLGISQEEAAQHIATSGSSVHFEVAKHKAMSNGLHAWLQTTPSTPGSTRTVIPPTGGAPPSNTPTTNFSSNGADKHESVSPVGKPTYPVQQSDLLFRHFRSNSTSALMKDPFDTSSIASSTSHTPGYASMSNSRLPPHYRPASRPTVVQPSRPISPSNLIVKRAVSPTPLYTAPVRSASTIPTINSMQQHSPIQQQLETKNSIPSSMTKSELNNELERLESKGPALTELEKKHYYNLLTQIQNFRPRIDQKYDSNSPQNINRNTIQTDIKHQATIPSTSDIHRHREDVISSVENLALRAMPFSNEDRYLISGDGTGYRQSSNSPSPLISAFRNSPNEDKGRKRVTFNEAKDNDQENQRFSTPDTPSTPMSAFEKIMAPTQKTIDDEDDQPRIQTVGTQEVYRNDPRQRRINEMQARLKKPTVDGSNLAFKDKMKMFAASIGETMPKNRYKTSSTEREIEKESTETSN